MMKSDIVNRNAVRVWDNQKGKILDILGDVVLFLPMNGSEPELVYLDNLMIDRRRSDNSLGEVELEVISGPAW